MQLFIAAVASEVRSSTLPPIVSNFRDFLRHFECPFCCNWCLPLLMACCKSFGSDFRYRTFEKKAHEIRQANDIEKTVKTLKSSIIPRTCNFWNFLSPSCLPDWYSLPYFTSKINELDLIFLPNYPFPFFFLPLLGLYRPLWRFLSIIY